MAVIEITGVRELERALRRLEGPLLNAALRAALKELGRDAIRIWRLETPKRTGATRRSYAAYPIVRRRSGLAPFRAELNFYVRPPADSWYAGVDRRHHMTKALVKRLRRRAIPVLEKHVSRAFAVAQRGG